MHPTCESLLAALREAKWRVQERTFRKAILPSEIANRYPSVPSDYLRLLGLFESCSNPSEQAWFISEADFNGTSNAAFRWNECEIMSLEAASGDQSWSKEIQDFWDCHLPFFFSVRGDYAFLAFSFQPDRYGSIVVGFGPEFEEVSEVSPSFASFLELLLDSVAGSKKSEALENII